MRPLQVLAGSVVAQGELDAVVTETGASTFFGKTVALLGQAQDKGHLQKVGRLARVVLGRDFVECWGGVQGCWRHACSTNCLKQWAFRDCELWWP